MLPRLLILIERKGESRIVANIEIDYRKKSNVQKSLESKARAVGSNTTEGIRGTM